MVRMELQRKLVATTLSAILSSFLFLSGCGELQLIEPEEPEQSASTEFQTVRQPIAFKPVYRKTVSSLAKERKKPSNKCLGTTETKKMEYKKGGKLEHCDHEMIVPPYALSQDEIMSITILSTSTIDVDFGRDGDFNTPVTVVISYEDADLDDIDEKDLIIVWFDEKRGVWYEIDSKVDTDEETVTGLADHFTQYTLSVR